jgi:hypothetical protein
MEPRSLFAKDFPQSVLFHLFSLFSNGFYFKPLEQTNHLPDITDSRSYEGPLEWHEGPQPWLIPSYREQKSALRESIQLAPISMRF